MKPRKSLIFVGSLITSLLTGSGLICQDLLSNLSRLQNYKSLRVSSYDRTGGNSDAISIEPGATAVLANIRGPAAIHHIWITIAAEPFYGRKLILRMYWDGEDSPSVEAPVGDFFGIGHGLNRNFSSLPIVCSSEGRARNCYWYMPFRRDARITITNEGTHAVDAFFYYIDYRVLKELEEGFPYFHAQYRQEMPCRPGENYVLLEAAGRGHYVGCNVSILQRTMGWWGEGDDMIYVDGEDTPSLHGTGSEDYFSDAWGMREDENLFYGCPLQEEDFQAGSKATVYRFHIPDPIPFQKSIRVTIEHGHANDRSDYFSSVAYWYQTEPHKPFPPLVSVDKRLPYALEEAENFIRPDWTESKSQPGSAFEDKKNGLGLKADRLSQFLTSYYGPDGSRYPVLVTEGDNVGSQADLTFPVEIREPYNIDFYFLKGPNMGNFTLSAASAHGQPSSASFEGYSSEYEIARISFPGVLLEEGLNSVVFRVTGKNNAAQGLETAFVGLSLVPSSRHFVTRWNLIGPFEAPDMAFLTTAYPPETEIPLNQKYAGKGGQEVSWKKAEADETGYMRLAEFFKPSEQVIAYGLAYVYSPETRLTHILLGSDDGVRVWLDDELVHSNAAYRGAYPDQDKIKVNLKKGWNKVLIKVLQGAGGWGFYLRFADPDGSLRYATEPKD
jgi:hypothetical protein